MAPERLLIINADDLGYDPEVTRGILQAMRAGLVSSATLMVNGPHSEQAARQASGLDIGLHLNLARWRPLSSPPSSLLVEESFSEANAPLLPTEVVEAEVRAQLLRLERLLGRGATHLDVHKHLHRHPNVLSGVILAARRFGLPVRAIDAAMRARLRNEGVPTTDHFIGDAGEGPYWTRERLAEQLATLGEGTTELMCHPGYRPTQVKSGYAAEREVELATFTHPGVAELLRQSGARVVSFAALPRST